MTDAKETKKRKAKDKVHGEHKKKKNRKSEPDHKEYMTRFKESKEWKDLEQRVVDAEVNAALALQEQEEKFQRYMDELVLPLVMKNLNPNQLPSPDANGHAPKGTPASIDAQVTAASHDMKNTATTALTDKVEVNKPPFIPPERYHDGSPSGNGYWTCCNLRVSLCDDNGCRTR